MLKFAEPAYLLLHVFADTGFYRRFSADARMEKKCHEQVWRIAVG